VAKLEAEGRFDEFDKLGIRRSARDNLVILCVAQLRFGESLDLDNRLILPGVQSRTAQFSCVLPSWEAKW
jgi:hypothetical protein